jgi:predicted membrane protein
LNGDWQKDATISIDAGHGDLTVIVPNDVGAIVDTDLGIGNVDADGFLIQGGSYTNDAYRNSAVTLWVDISSGVGQVTLNVAE